MEFVKQRPRILLVSAHCPHGEIYGAQLRTLNIARVLQQCGSLEIVLFPFSQPSEDSLAASQKEFTIRRIFFFSQPSCGSIPARFDREFNPYSADTEAKRLPEHERIEMLMLADQFDLIWFYGISIPNCLGRRRWSNSVLDIDDVPSQCFRGKAKEAEGYKARFMARRKIFQWKRREKVLLDRFDVLSVSSAPDREFFGASERVHIIPNGFDPPCHEIPRRSVTPPRIGFIGTFNYGPNLDGVKWFAEKVLPLILKREPDVQIRLVGVGTDYEIFSNQANIEGLGFVADSEAEIASWTLMIVPIFVGGGTRIKIAEAFSRGCPVVSTSQGAYGYNIQSGDQCILADTAHEFAEACLSLINDTATCDGLIRRAKEMFDRELDWKAIAPNIIKTVEYALHQTQSK